MVTEFTIKRIRTFALACLLIELASFGRALSIGQQARVALVAAPMLLALHTAATTAFGHQCAVVCTLQATDITTVSDPGVPALSTCALCHVGLHFNGILALVLIQRASMA
jgi:hypothetical protein